MIKQSFKLGQLYHFTRRYFPRVVNKQEILSDQDIGIGLPLQELPPDMKNMKEKVNRKIKGYLNKDEESDTDDGESEVVEYDPRYEEYRMAKVNQSILNIPEDIQNTAQKVFTRHVTSDIRYWSRKFLLNYSQNHACEPPINLNNLPKDSPLFANSEELSIKVKLFNTMKNNKEKEIQGDGIKLDKNVTIDVEEEKRLNKDKEVINPIKVEYKQAQSVAYLQCRMPYTYQVTKRITNEIRLRMPDFKPTSVLDYGAGLGSSIWAAHDTYGSLTKLAAVEPNTIMRKLGKFLTNQLKTEIIWVESLTMIPGTGIDRGKFDLIYLSYVLQELPTSKLRLMVLDTLWNRLSNDGVLVVIEPGSPKGFRFIHDLRKWVINKSRADANIIAPCPHHLECPLASKSDTWCHFSQLSYKYDKDVFPKMRSEKNIFNEKFCYLAIKKGKTPNIVYKSEKEASTNEEKSFFWDRIVRPVIRQHKHKILDLCTKRGRLERRVISKSQGTIGGYKTVKRLNWGDLWYLPYWLPNKFRKERSKGKRLW